MKFIIRNLGWILLIMFFLFMLYLISNQKNTQNNLSKNIVSDSGSIFIKDTDNKNIKIKDSKNTKLEENKKSNGIVSTIKNFFTKDEKKDINDILIDDSDFVLGDSTKKEFSMTNDNNKELEKQEKNNLDNVISEVSLDDKKIQNFKNKKIREVAVKSIFLNNAYFTKRLYTVYNGDKLEQLTKTNSYGCFKVKVISTKNKLALNKQAWTCEYYMKDKKSDVKKYQNIAKNYYKNLKFKINSIHSVGVSALKLNNYNFTKKLGIVYYGDKLKQLTKLNKFGCFKAKVISSKNKFSINKISWVCSKYLK